MKTCNKCKNAKSFTEFFKDKGFKDGHSSICKVCKTAATYEWRKNNKKSYNNGAKSWRANNPDKQHANEIKRHYGLDIADYNKMLLIQNSECAICRKPHDPSVKRGRLYVDHCHITGKIRGLLCGGCNSGIGYFEDNIETLNKAISYIEASKRLKIVK